jgi:DNA-binding XRE family transcriptional regulator|nr:MAG TPA: Helix-turn-helix XRE-family like protein [Inoviridae sp.]
MNIKTKRIELNKTQEEVARKTDITLRAYQQIEKNNTCNVKNAIKIAKELNSTVEELFSEINKT